MRLPVVNLIEKSSPKSFNNGIVYHIFGSQNICTMISRQYTQLFYNLYAGATECGKPLGGCNFGNNLAVNVPKSHRGKVDVFCLENFRSRHNFTIWNPVCNLPLRIILKPRTLSCRRDTFTESGVTLKVSRRTHKLANFKDLP